MIPQGSTIIQDLTKDPRLDYLRPTHSNLQYFHVNGESITVGQLLDRWNALSYIYRHRENNQLFERLAPVGLPEHPPSHQQQTQYRSICMNYGIIGPVALQRYTAWYKLATEIITTGILPSLPEDDHQPESN